MLHLEYYTDTLSNYYYIKKLIREADNVKQLDSIKTILLNVTSMISHRVQALYDDFEKHWWSFKRFKWYRKYDSFSDLVIEELHKELNNKYMEFSKNKLIKIKGFNICSESGG